MYHVAEKVPAAIDFTLQQKEKEIHLWMNKVISYSDIKKIQHCVGIRSNSRQGLILISWFVYTSLSRKPLSWALNNVKNPGGRRIWGVRVHKSQSQFIILSKENGDKNWGQKVRQSPHAVLSLFVIQLGSYSIWNGQLLECFLYYPLI